MLSPAIAKDVIDHAMFLGADFAELFVEQSRTHSIELISNEIDKINGGIDFGIGIRLFFGTKVLYGYTNSTDKKELLKILITFHKCHGFRAPEIKSTLMRTYFYAILHRMS